MAVKKSLDTDEAAAYLSEHAGVRVKAGTLAMWRCTKRGPAFHKLGHSVLYSVKDLDAFARSWVRINPAATKEKR